MTQCLAEKSLREASTWCARSRHFNFAEIYFPFIQFSENSELPGPKPKQKKTNRLPLYSTFGSSTVPKPLHISIARGATLEKGLQNFRISSTTLWLHDSNCDIPVTQAKRNSLRPGSVDRVQRGLSHRDTLQCEGLSEHRGEKTFFVPGSS